VWADRLWVGRTEARAAAAARRTGRADPRATPADLPTGLVLSLAQFVTKDGKSVPGPARLEFLYRSGGEWRMSALEDPQSNVFTRRCSTRPKTVRACSRSAAPLRS